MWRYVRCHCCFWAVVHVVVGAVFAVDIVADLVVVVALLAAVVTVVVVVAVSVVFLLSVMYFDC